jgi:hypothetical protein
MNLQVFGVPLVALLVSALVGAVVGFLFNRAGRPLVSWVFRWEVRRDLARYNRLAQAHPEWHFRWLFKLPSWVPVAYPVVVFVSVILGLLASIVTLTQFFGVRP